MGKDQLLLINLKLTHEQLVESAYKWVLGQSCGVAFRELVTTACNGEIPDVIGFGSGGHSVVVECKTSRNDFLCDKNKHFRKTPELGMGRYRYYCCPTGLIKKDELPDGWGLVYVNEKGRATCVSNPYGSLGGNIRHGGFAQNLRAEHGLMYSALRRLHLRWFEGKRMIEQVYTQPYLDNSQTPQ